MTQSTTTLGTIIAHTTKTGNTTYKYMLDGKVLRTSTRNNYRYSTKDGSVFSARLDLLYKNASYVREYTWATQRAGLTLEALIAEQTKALKQDTKEYAKYTNDDNLQKEINDTLSMYNRNGTLTEERKKDAIARWTKNFAYWASIAKEGIEKHSALLNDPDALNEELARINRGGKARLAELRIVEYVEQ